MTIKVLNDAFISINGVDLSDRAESVEVEYSEELKDAGVFGDTGMRRLGVGVKEGRATVNFRQDFAASEVHATMNGIVGVEVAIKVRSDKTAAIGVTNPEFQFNGMLSAYAGVAGAFKDVHTFPLTWLNSDGLAPLWATA